MTGTLKTNRLILCAFFATLTVVGTIISIPLPFSPVPINMALLSVFLAGSLLGAKLGALSQLVYICLGAAGLPVFSKFSGGAAILVGPTGGYIIGYIVAAFLVGLITQKIVSFGPKTILGFLAGLAACYALGTLWFIYVTDTTLWTALLMCVIPFLPGDGVKIFLAFILTKKLKPFIKMSN
ncbi:MAG: biotin transporter BioY [Parabacteroides sp.]|nr:biotin transporter BioY [Parabacteroides sp.]